MKKTALNDFETIVLFSIPGNEDNNRMRLDATVYLGCVEDEVEHHHDGTAMDFDAAIERIEELELAVRGDEGASIRLTLAGQLFLIDHYREMVEHFDWHTLEGRR